MKWLPFPLVNKSRLICVDVFSLFFARSEARKETKVRSLVSSKFSRILSLKRMHFRETLDLISDGIKIDFLNQHGSKSTKGKIVDSLLYSFPGEKPTPLQGKLILGVQDTGRPST